MKDQPIYYLFILKEETNDFSMLNSVIYLTSKQMTGEHWNKIMTLELIFGFNIPSVRDNHSTNISVYEMWESLSIQKWVLYTHIYIYI